VSDGNGTKVTAESLDGEGSESCVIKDDYNLITDGDCYVHNIQVHVNGTHVITIKNVGGAR